MKIDTLVDDIRTVLSTPTIVSSNSAERFGRELATLIVDRLAQHEREPTLRMSSICGPCERKVYYSVNASRQREALDPEVRLKFLIGDVCEAVLLFLAESAGHLVEGQQDELDIGGVKGHRDAIIDGVVVDAKSASPLSFKKFKSGLVPEDDAFGYLGQLGSYGYASMDDVRVTDHERQAFLVFNKVDGNICLDEHPTDNKDYDRIYDLKKSMVNKAVPPPRPVFDEPEGKSGNRKLGTLCSYCDFKKHCWPGLQAYAYAGGPKYLTKVVKEPDVPRIF